MADRTDLAQDSQESATSSPEMGDGEIVRLRSSRKRNVAIGTGGVLAVLLAGAWVARDRIAGQVIDSQLAALDLPATYRIESIGPGVEVLRDIVVGDPRHPDLTIDRAEVRLVYGLGAPRIGKIKLVRPRLYGSYLRGKVSFGVLDRLLFAPDSKEPFRMPDYDLTLEDARGLIESDYGRLAVKADGAGKLRGGFAGTLAAISPGLASGDCRAGRTTAFGTLAITGEKPRFVGPLRMANLQCGTAGMTITDAALQLDALADKDFKGVTATGHLRTAAIGARAAKAGSLALDTALSWRDGALNGRIAANAGAVASGQGSIALLGLDGLVRARDGFSTVEFRGSVDGQGLRRGASLTRALASAQSSAQGTLLAPMAAQIGNALAREERGSRLAGDITARSGADGWSLVVPNATLRGGSGQALLALSRFQVSGNGQRTPTVVGNFSTSGAGLPRIAGQMEQAAAGRALFRLTMAEYRAGGGALAVPDMMVAQLRDGSLGFSGTAQLSGAVPGGSVTNLILPVQGAYASNGELALWRRCISPRFDRLQLGQMALDARTLTLCPAGGAAMVRSGAAGLRVAAGTSSLALSGRFGDTPMRIASGAVGLAYPGVVTAREVDVVLGPEATATRFRLGDLVAKTGKDFSGTFGGVEARLAAVPLDVTNAAGQWRYADNRLFLSGTSFEVTDRMNPARFEKLVAKDATLTLFDNRIDAEALLREPATGREVVRATTRHDLGDATGHADLAVGGLVFDKALQPDQLTRLALGVVANVGGTVRGKGRVDWNAKGVTSTGDFTSDALDLAAAFGPVKGLSGTLHFTDLLGLVTAPHQKLKVASVNPGIEVTDGTVDIQMLPDQVLRLNSAIWPFLGGTLSLEPTDLRLAIAEERRYTLSIVGLDAAKFVERMELGNLSATGTFDGRMPLVFDANGGRIVDGMLVSRPPGGNVSYVGALSYKDLSTMANFAFDALKSMDYKTMTIGMQGDLEGEVVTRVKFDGVKQGAGTKQNFLTRKVANLPIQFNVNIRAPFYQLITSLKAMYDPAAVKDPRTLGLVDAKGRAVRGAANGVRPGGTPVIVLPANATVPAPATRIQPSDSGNMP